MGDLARVRLELDEAGELPESGPRIILFDAAVWGVGRVEGRALLRRELEVAGGQALVEVGDHRGAEDGSASLSGGQLRIEGSGAIGGTVVLAESGTSAAGARADTKGAFKIEASGFRADDCRVTVSKSGGPVATPVLSGCTPKPVTPPVDTPPSGSCVITAGPAVTFHAGDVSSDLFATTGCDTSSAPVQWSLDSGRIPPGMSAPRFQGQTGGAVAGTPNLEGTYTFTVRVTDSVGATDVETFTITVVAPRPWRSPTRAARRRPSRSP